MAILSNINGKFAVDSSGGIQFSGQTGTSGYVLKSNGNAAPTWVDGSTVIGGPYLPLSGGTLTGATATASGISFTVGGALTVSGTINSGAITSTGLINGRGISSGQSGESNIANETGETWIGSNGLRYNTGAGTFARSSATAQAAMMVLTDTADVEFYAQPSTSQTGTYALSPKMVIKGATGNVGIGTTSPSIATSLHIRNATSSSYATLRLEGSNRGGILEMYQGAYPVSKIQTDQSGNTYFSTSGVFGSTTLSAKMTILTAGNVGIGTTSPDQQLDVAKSAIIGSESVISSTTNSENMLIVKGKNNYSDGTTWYGNYGQILLDVSSNMTGSAKKYLITNALDNNKFAIVRSDFNAIPTVNSTANGVNIGTADFVIDNSGKVGIGTTLPTSQLYVNNTADGDKIRWGRSDALVGSVGTYNGVPYIGYQGGAGGGIMFNGLSIEPTALGSTRSDDTNDIGSVNNRWKNIYLGGGAFLGGTGAANKLDYYEEGTWTPVIAHNNGTGVVPATVSEARYIRVGGLVYVSAYLTSINPTGTAGGSGNYYGIRGMPYTPENYGAWQIVYASGPITAYGGYSSSASLYFMSNGTNGQRSQVHVNGAGVNAWGSNKTLMMNCVYNIL